MVRVQLPPPLRYINPQIHTLKKNTQLRRIFDPTRYGATAIGFRNFGAVSRFDHHRFVNDVDPDRSVIYAGFTLSCCIAEYFGDGTIINSQNVKLALIYLAEEVKLLDLRGEAAMKAGTVAAISGIIDRNITQKWSKYFYEHPELYGNVDGLIFSGAHNGEDAIALYERCQSKIDKSDVEEIELANPSLRRTLIRIASRQGLIIE